MKKRILAVDDDPDILDVYTMILEAEDYEVKTLLSPDNLAAAIMDFEPNLILLDIQLGFHNGLTICKKLKQDDATRSIPVFMVSAHESIYSSKSECGADEYIAKPFDISSLTDIVNDYLSARIIPLMPNFGQSRRSN